MVELVSVLENPSASQMTRFSPQSRFSPNLKFSPNLRFLSQLSRGLEGFRSLMLGLGPATDLDLGLRPMREHSDVCVQLISAHSCTGTLRVVKCTALAV